MKKKVSVSILIGAISLVVALLAGILIGYLVGFQQEITASVKNDALSKNAEYVEISDKLKKMKEEMSENKPIYDSFVTYKEDVETANQKLTDLTSQVSTAETNLNNLLSDIETKQQELNKLTADVLQATGAPKTLPSGDYIVGTDLPAGRYTVSGSSNFQVYTSSGSVYINTILGNSRVGDGDYTATLNDGMIMHCAAKTTFTPIS